MRCAWGMGQCYALTLRVSKELGNEERDKKRRKGKRGPKRLPQLFCTSDVDNSYVPWCVMTAWPVTRDRRPATFPWTTVKKKKYSENAFALEFPSALSLFICGICSCSYLARISMTCTWAFLQWRKDWHLLQSAQSPSRAITVCTYQLQRVTTRVQRNRPISEEVLFHSSSSKPRVYSDMSAPAPRPAQVRSLYRSLLRHTSLITNYNFRSHAMRRTKSGFLMNRTVSGDELTAVYTFGLKQLAIAKRQSLISQLYPDSMSSVMQIGPKLGSKL